MKAVAFADFFDRTLNRDVRKGELIDITDTHLDGLLFLGLADEYIEPKKKGGNHHEGCCGTEVFLNLA